MKRRICLVRHKGDDWFVLHKGDDVIITHCGHTFRRTNKRTDGGWLIYVEV